MTSPPPAAGPEGPQLLGRTDPRHGSGTQSRAVLGDLFAAVDRLGARRTTDSWVAGVCDGLALRMGIDPVVLRVSLIVLSLFGGLGVILYAAGWLLLPAPDGPSVLQRTAARPGQPIVVLALLALLGAALVMVTLGLFGNGGWWPSQLVLVLVLGAALYAATARPRRPAAPVGAPPGPTPSTPPPAPAGMTPALVSTSGAAEPLFAAPYSGQPGPGGTVPDPTSNPQATDPTLGPVGGPDVWPPVARVPAAPVAGASSWTGQQAGSTQPTAWAHQSGAAQQSMSPPILTAGDASALPAPAAWSRPATPGPSGWVSPVAGSGTGALPPPVPRRLRRKRLSAWIAVSLLGLAVAVATGVSLMHGAQGWAGHGPTVGLAVALGLVALVLLVAGLTGRRGGLTTLLALALAATTGVSLVAADPAWSGGIGDRYWTASAPTASAYRLGVGTATLDLANLLEPGPGEGPLHIPVNVAFGEITVLLPPDRTVTVTSDLSAGAVYYDDVRLTDHDPVRHTRTFGSGEPDVVVTIRMTGGDVRIRGAQ